MTGAPNALEGPAGKGANTVLELVEITKSYAGVRALRGASLALRKGEVHALVGENGAGKSTLIKVVTGAIEPDSGEMLLDGEPVTHNSPRRARSLGIAAIYQQPALFPDLTVAENLALGVERTHPWRRLDWAERRRRARHLLAEVGARIDPDREAGELSMPEQQLAEIARALGASARVLVLDEPTASLSEDDTQNLFRVIRRLRDQDVSMIYISHRLEELHAIADRVTVLRDGATIDTRPMTAVTRPDLIQLMVGRALSSVFPKREVEQGDVVLELRGLSSRAASVHDVDLEVRAGEILALAGLVGAGRTELAQTVFGLRPADAGEVRLRGKAVRFASPAEAIAAGIAYVPEDRRQHGVILDLPVSANVSLASLDRLAGWSGLDTAREKELATRYVRRLGIKTPALFAPVATLSGGNQQKVALSRWLATKPAVLILDEPTQGVDVGAKSEIHSLMVELAAQGVAIVMISSELPEVLGMADRIAVMRAGRIAGTLSRAEATQEGILALALGDHPQVSGAVGATE
jgi:rhamnose transport system ATP-binding protein